MRRHVPFIALALALGVWLGAVPAASPATPAAPAGSGFVGAWQLLSRSPGQAPTPALFTFFADGTVLGSGLPVQPAGAGVVFISAGHGVWQPTGTGTASATLVLLVVDARGSFRGTETDQLQVRLGPDGRTCRGSFHATVADPNGRVENTLSGTIQGTRVVVGPSGTPPGTPTA